MQLEKIVLLNLVSFSFCVNPNSGGGGLKDNDPVIDPSFWTIYDNIFPLGAP